MEQAWIFKIKMKALIVVLLFASSVCSAFVGPSGAHLKVCNTGTQSFSMFRVTPVRGGILGNDTWHIEAWWPLKSGECTEFWSQNTSYDHNYSNFVLGFTMSVKGLDGGNPQSWVPVKAVQHALIPHLFSNGNGADRFKWFGTDGKGVDVCLAPSDRTDYEIPDGQLYTRACKSGAVRLLAVVEFIPFSIDVEDEKQFLINVNPEDELNLN